jgi:PAS domain S-box-containing protein
VTAAPESAPITLVVVDDTPDVRLLLKLAFGQYDDFEVVGEAGDGRAGVELVTRLQPDAVLLDLAMPVMDGLEALPLMRAAAPHARIVVLSGFESSQMATTALGAGASAYIQKGAAPDEIVAQVARSVGVTPKPRRRKLASVPSDPGVAQVLDYAIVTLTPEGNIASWNAGAERLKGYTSDEAIGQHFAMLYTEADRANDVPAHVLRVAGADGRFEQDGWRMRKDGTTFWANVVVTALHDPAGRLTGYTKVTRDHTEEHRLQQAQASSFAAVSHDLRAPIGLIKAYAALLPNVSPAERVEFADRIESIADRVRQMVEGLFDYAKLRAGGMPINREPVRLSELATECVRDHALHFGEHEILVEDSPAVALADRAAMQTVLENLISNAAKYSPADTCITITFAIAGDRVRMRVSDQGRGIDPADLPTIFTEFVRGRLAQNDGGTGLGLASVRQLLTLQSGQVWLDSELGRGTTVTVELPRAPTPTVI